MIVSLKVEHDLFKIPIYLRQDIELVHQEIYILRTMKGLFQVNQCYIHIHICPNPTNPTTRTWIQIFRDFLLLI